MVTLQAAMMAMLLSSPGQMELLDFYSDSCAPCRAMMPTIQALEAKGYHVKKVNISQNRELTAQYRVDSVPCYILVSDGKEVERLSGTTTFSRLERMFKTAAAKAGAPPNAGLTNNNPANNNPANTNSPNSPPGAVMPMGTLQNQQTPPLMAGNVNPPTEPANAQLSDAQLIAASVRIRVEDSAGHSCGSGTIIDARGGRALILTCGHVFRDSQGKGKIEIELFGPHAGQKVEGRLESYDSEDRDVGLVSIQISEPIVAARLAPVGYNVREGDAVASVGCDHGADPTVRKNHRINLANGSNLWVNDQPTEGRSGGGLFSAEGYVIGLCKGRDPQDHEGCYPSLVNIRTQLDQANLAFVYQSPQGWEKLATANPAILLASHNVPVMPSEMPGLNATMPPPASALPGSSGLSSGEQEALDEIHRHLKDGSEVVCVIRPRNVPGAKSEVIMLDKASSALISQLKAESLSRDNVERTSHDEARPRKKLLEWSIGENVPQVAP